MGRKAGSRPRRRTPRAVRSNPPPRRPSIGALADTIVRGGRELLKVTDPLEAEAWASAMVGTFYKVEAPLDARDELEAQLLPAVVERAEARRDTVGLAVLEALAAVADQELAVAARSAAGRLGEASVAAPPWAAELGTVAYEGAWMLHDVFGDHEAYFATFRYPGRPPHIVNALYDKAMGEIIKDAFVGYTRGDPRRRVKHEDGVATVDAEPGAMARRVIDAIASGDMYLDNDWTPEFKRFRALILARMRLLPIAPAAERREAPGGEEREAIVTEFLASTRAEEHDEADVIANQCLDYLCDYLGEDPFRWSPIVVEQFLLDYLPRKVQLSLRTVAQLPTVLRAWVRFALTKRGLEDRWIVETERAVDRHAKAFRNAMTDADQFGPAKLLGNAMLADGVDPLDQGSVDAWVSRFNARPLAERDALLRRFSERWAGPGP